MRNARFFAMFTIGLIVLVSLYAVPDLILQVTALANEEPEESVDEVADAEPSTPLVGSGTGEYPVPPPPFSDEDIFPCMECHEIIDTNAERRVLEEYHEEIVFEHDPQNRWCLDCHDAENRDVLRLASGATVPFEESYRLCGQCHGPKLRDWKAGVHGRRTGRWDGKERYYLLCVHCHDPHSPKYPKIEPHPTPIPPDQTRESLTTPYEPIELEEDPHTTIEQDASEESEDRHE